LVGFAFVEGYFYKATINHINGDKLDNRPENLEWVTLAKNSSLEWETGLVNLNGENHPSSILTSKKVIIIRELIKKGINCNKISILAGVSAAAIYKIKNGINWKSVSCQL